MLVLRKYVDFFLYPKSLKFHQIDAFFRQNKTQLFKKFPHPPTTAFNDIKELGHNIVTQGNRPCCDKCGQSWTKGTRAHLISLGPCPGLQP